MFEPDSMHLLVCVGKINLGIFVSTLKIPRLVFDLLHPCLSHFAALYIIIFLVIVMYNPDTNGITR